MNITKYMQAASMEAAKSDFEYRIGCVIVRGGKIVGRGYNHYSAKQEWASKRYGCDYYSIHAEIDALVSCDNAVGATMFITGVKHNGNPINTKPCSKCSKILKHVGIDVYYTSKSGVHKLELS